MPVNLPESEWIIRIEIQLLVITFLLAFGADVSLMLDLAFKHVSRRACNSIFKLFISSQSNEKKE